MATKTRGRRKRESEEDWEAEDAGKQKAEGKRARTQKQRRNKKYIGAHVSIQGKLCGHFSRLSLAEPSCQHCVSFAGGIWKAVEACAEIGANCFGLFLGSQRSWSRTPLDHKAAARFQEQRSLHGIDPAHILPHGSYLMNCGSPKTGLSVTGGCLRPLIFIDCFFTFLHKPVAVETFNYLTLISSISVSYPN